MASAHPPGSRCSVPAGSGSERGFTLIEVVIVLVISAVMLAMAVLTMDSDQSTAKRADAVAAARVLADAIEDFRKDHGGRPPAIGTSDWPSAPAKLRRGPVNTYTGRAYQRKRTISALESGVAVVAAGSTVAPAPVRFTLQYNRSAAGSRPGGWYIVVVDRLAKIRSCHVTGGSISIPASAGEPC